MLPVSLLLPQTQMAIATLHTLAFTNSNPAASTSLPLSRLPPAPPSLGLLRPTLSIPRRHTNHLRNRNRNRNPSLLFSAASHHESASDINIHKEVGSQESQQAWQQALAAFKEQALKMQGLSKEAYERYSEKAIIILKETSEKLKIQSDEARQDLSVILKQVSEESKEYFGAAAENSPEPLKDIIETFAVFPDKFTDVSNLRDFYIGIPYGALLSVGGFLSFMLTGSIPAIRFGIILGGTLLALGILSLRSWKKGEPSPLAVEGQAVIATILFLKELRSLSMHLFIPNFIATLISGGVLAFYLYRIVSDRRNSGVIHPDVEPDN